MVITESELREMWRDGRQELPAFPPGTRFSPAAQDFLKDHKLEIRFASDGRALAGTPQTPPAGQPPSVTSYQLPIPLLQARLDSLDALLGLAAAESRRYHLPELAGHLEALAEYCHALTAMDASAPPSAALHVAGKSADEIQAIVGAPEQHLSVAHARPGAQDHAILHWLNVLGTQAREAEAMALQSGGSPTPGLAGELHHVASAVDYLALLFKAGPLAWKPGYGG